MKFLISLILLAFSTSIFANSTKIYEARISRGSDLVAPNAIFQVDMATAQGYAKITATETYFEQTPPSVHCDRNGCRTIPGQRVSRVRNILNDKAYIRGLTLIDKKIVYSQNGQNIVCGKLGRSRVLRRPTIYLTGKCKLVASIDFYDILTVYLKTSS